MPYRIHRSASMEASDPMLQVSARTEDCIGTTIAFLAHHAPKDLRVWIDGVEGRLDTPYEKIIRAALEYQGTQNIVATTIDKEPPPAPSEVPIPTLDKHHWAHQRHFNPGRQRNHFDDYNEVSTDEVRQDIGTIRRYLQEYDRLAKHYSGVSLTDATDCPKFSDPYHTCIDVCVFDIKLPSHFLALIHYGIGLQFLWQTARNTPDRRLAEHTLAPLFERLTEFYVEDFRRTATR